MENNPYSAPSIQVISSPLPAIADDQRAEFREVVIAWEKLRLAYNGLLLVPGLMILIPAWQMIGLGSIFGCIVVAIGANVCFFLGPVSEVYIRAFFHPIRTNLLRRILFAAGLIVSLAFFGFMALTLFVTIPDQT